MTSILYPGLLLHLEAEYHDCLGWENFLKGCICTQLGELRAQEQDLVERITERNVDYWY